MVQDQFEDNAGRKKSARTPEKQTKINSLVSANNEISVKRLAFAVVMKKSSVHNIPRKDLHLTPYKPQISQELKEGEDIKTLAFFQKIQDMIERGKLDPMKIFLLMSPMFILKALQVNRKIAKGACLNQIIGIQFPFTLRKSLFCAG